MGTVRCFAGIPLADPARSHILSARDALRAGAPGWRDEKWVADDNLHVTLHFMGALEEPALDELLVALDEAIRFERFVLPLAGITAVPGTRHCRMLWASFLDPDEACAELAEQVQHAALAFGIPVEDRTFKPHATLCRARRPRPFDTAALEDANDLLGSSASSMSVGRVTVFASRLSPRGPVYTALRDWHARGE